MTDNYKRDFQIGAPRPQEKDPWFYCVIGMNSYYSDIADEYGPTNDSCRKYMSQRCSKTWDKACDFYSYNNESVVPDENLSYELYPLESQKLKEGHKHVLRTFSEKYCRKQQDPSSTGHCWIRKEQFNPLVVNSPELSYTRGDCLMTCDILDENDKDPDDPIVKKIIDDYKLFKIATPHLLSLCKTAQASKKPLKGNLKEACALLNISTSNESPTVILEDAMSDPPVEEKKKEEKGYAGIVIFFIVFIAVVLCLLGFALKRELQN